ncbi:MAG: hypothetical protein J6P12_11220, partial [Methanobrevibacter sp.]|nr:hypothetical protein [Methanobrevibacter sp.]
MKIISWNCNGKFREKFKEIIEEDADIYVICECENPAESKSEEYKEFAGNNYAWVGDIHYKGLGIFAKEEIKLEKRLGINENFKNFILLNVNDSFNLLGVWAMPPYVEMIHDYFDANEKIFDEDLIMCGDFNSNVIWNNEHKTTDDNGNAKDQTTPYLLGLNNNQVFNKNDLPVGAITATNRPALYTVIQNIQQLQNMQSNLAGNYAVVNHIDATETKDWNGGQGFNPIGDENNSFKGKLDGLGHTVSKLSINRSGQDYIGLIGYAWGAQIRNIGLLSANIRGQNYVGALVGYNLNGSINNAY